MTFVARITGAAPRSIQWTNPRGERVAGATTASLDLADVQPAQAGVWTVNVDLADGRTGSATCTLAVLERSTSEKFFPRGVYVPGEHA